MNKYKVYFFKGSRIDNIIIMASDKKTVRAKLKIFIPYDYHKIATIKKL